MVDPVATIGGLLFNLTELGTMRGDDGGAPRGLRAHQKPLRNKDHDHTPTDAPTGEPKPKKTPPENQVESVAPPITGQRKTPFHKDRTQRARGSKSSTSEYRQTKGTAMRVSAIPRTKSKGASNAGETGAVQRVRRSNSNRGQRVPAGVYGRRPAARHRTKTNCEQKVERKNQKQSSSRRRSSSKGADRPGFMGDARRRETDEQRWREKTSSAKKHKHRGAQVATRN